MSHSGSNEIKNSKKSWGTLTCFNSFDKGYFIAPKSRMIFGLRELFPAFFCAEQSEGPFDQEIVNCEAPAILFPITTKNAVNSAYKSNC